MFVDHSPRNRIDGSKRIEFLTHVKWLHKFLLSPVVCVSKHFPTLLSIFGNYLAIANSLIAKESSGN